MILNVEERLVKFRTKLYLDNPLLGFILQYIHVIEDNSIVTAATDGLRIFYNREFMNNLSDDSFDFIIFHELMHILLDHPRRGIGKDHQKFNVACDIVVNDILINYGVSYGELKPILGEDYQADGVDETPEMIYKYLELNQSSGILDSHDKWIELSSEEIEIFKNILNESIKTYGSEVFNKYIHAWLKDNNQFYPWKKVLESFLIKSNYDFVYQRTDKRFSDVLLPDFYYDEGTLKSVWLLIDVSGSMDENIGDALGELVSIIRHHRNLELDVSCFSTIVTKPKKIRRVDEIDDYIKSVKSTRGTNFHIIFSELDKYFSRTDLVLVIVITDGKGRYPNQDKAKGIPVIWAINNTESSPPFGTIIRI